MALEDRLTQLEADLAEMKVDIKQILIDLKELALRDQNPLAGVSAAQGANADHEAASTPTRSGSR